jgi:hypothetical protein
MSMKRVLTTFSSKPQDDRYDHFTREDIHTRPRGYPQLAGYVSADIDGRLYRRFGYLRNRLLLHKQDAVIELEAELAQLDATDFAGDDIASFRLLSRRYDEEDPDCPRRKLLDRLDVALREYDELLLREHEILTLKQPSKKEHRSYFNFIWNEKPLYKDEYAFIYREDDFVRLGRQDDSWLGYTEVFFSVLPDWILKGRAIGKGTQFFSNARTVRLVKMIAVTCTSLLLVLPIVVLYLLTASGASDGVKIGVTVVFVVLFALALAGLTHASRHDLFAASAAYCAVLVVFLGNVPGSQTSTA